MKKNKTIISTLFLLTLIASPTIKANNSFYSFIHKINILRHQILLFKGPIAGTQSFINKIKLATFPQSPEIITQFCKEKLTAQGLDSDKIAIIVDKKPSFLAAFSKTHIIIGQAAANEFQKALESPTDENSKNIIRIYSTFLDHEIAHLKNNDAPNNRLLALTGASLLNYAITLYIIKSSQLKDFFQEPTNIKEFLIGNTAYNLMYLLDQIIIKSLNSQYAQYQEKRADAYAISQAKDPEALRCAAKYLETIENKIIDAFCGAPINPKLPQKTQHAIKFIHSMLKLQYKLQKSTVDFRSWVMQQKKTIAILRLVIDSEHPSGFSRAQKMRTAADDLDSKKN